MNDWRIEGRAGRQGYKRWRVTDGELGDDGETARTNVGNLSEEAEE